MEGIIPWPRSSPAILAAIFCRGAVSRVPRERVMYAVIVIIYMLFTIVIRQQD